MCCGLGFQSPRGQGQWGQGLAGSSAINWPQLGQRGARSDPRPVLRVPKSGRRGRPAPAPAPAPARSCAAPGLRFPAAPSRPCGPPRSAGSAPHPGSGPPKARPPPLPRRRKREAPRAAQPSNPRNFQAAGTLGKGSPSSAGAGQGRRGRGAGAAAGLPGEPLPGTPGRPHPRAARRRTRGAWRPGRHLVPALPALGLQGGAGRDLTRRGSARAAASPRTGGDTQRRGGGRDACGGALSCPDAGVGADDADWRRRPEPGGAARGPPEACGGGRPEAAAPGPGEDRRPGGMEAGGRQRAAAGPRARSPSPARG